MAQGLVELFNQVAGRQQKKLAFRGQVDWCGGTVHESHTHRLLQCAYAATEGRLGDMSLPCGNREAAGISQCHEVFKPFCFEVHRNSRREQKVEWIRLPLVLITKQGLM